MQNRPQFTRYSLMLSLLLSLTPNLCFAENHFPFQAELNSDNINIRSDSTISAESICSVDKGEKIEVVQESYDWYKIRLPKTAPSFIKKDLTICIESKLSNLSNTQAEKPCRNARVIKERVNIRLHPNEGSAILGKVSKNEVVNISSDRGGWYRIEPVANSFGWVYKKFVIKISPVMAIEPTAIEKEEKAKPLETIEIEGTIYPYGKVFMRVATHKLITKEQASYLLKGNKKILNGLSYHKVKIKGKILNYPRERFPVIEVIALEALD